MSVIIETSIGDITVDLYTDERPRCCLNFLKLCKIKYYNFSLFHTIQESLVAQCGDPTASGRGGESIFSHIYGDQARFFDMEVSPRIKHTKKGLISMVNNGSGMHGSQFVLTLAENLDYLDGKHTVFGEVTEGFDIVDKLNKTFCDEHFRPHQDIRIYHTVILDDPYDDPDGLTIPAESPGPTREMLDSDRIACDADIHEDEGKTEEELAEMKAEREEKANTQILEMVGDIPDTDIAPPENVLFVCKLNPVTTSEDLEIIFSRFGTIVSCDVIKDSKTGESLQYAFIEFESQEQCETAYFKMDNVLIDDRRIHVDFSQSVSKLKWKGKGQGVDVLPTGSAPAYVLKNQQRQSHGYDLVYEDDMPMGNAPVKGNKKGKKHKAKRSRSRSPSEDDKRTKSKEDKGGRYQESRHMGGRNNMDRGDYQRHDRMEQRGRRGDEGRHSNNSGDRRRSPRRELRIERRQDSEERHQQRRDRQTSPLERRQKRDRRSVSADSLKREERKRRVSADRSERKVRKRSRSEDRRDRRDRSESREGRRGERKRSRSVERKKHKRRGGSSDDSDGIGKRGRSRSRERDSKLKRYNSPHRKHSPDPPASKKHNKKSKKKSKKYASSSEDESDDDVSVSESEDEKEKRLKKKNKKRKTSVSSSQSSDEDRKERQEKKSKKKKKKHTKRHDSSDGATSKHKKRRNEGSSRHR